MNKMKLFALAVLPALALGSSLAVAQDNRSPEQLTPQQPAPSKTEPVPAGSFRPQGRIIVPLSSNTKGVHTNTEIFVPAGRPISTPVPDFTFAETPASIGCVYNVEPITLKSTGCNASTLGNHEHPSGGWGAIAVVDAFDDPNITSDLAFFDKSYGLPTANVNGGLRQLEFWHSGRRLRTHADSQLQRRASKRQLLRLGLRGVIGRRVGACDGAFGEDYCGRSLHPEP